MTVATLSTAARASPPTESVFPRRLTDSSSYGQCQSVGSTRFGLQPASVRTRTGIDLAKTPNPAACWLEPFRFSRQSIDLRFITGRWRQRDDCVTTGIKLTLFECPVGAFSSCLNHPSCES